MRMCGWLCALLRGILAVSDRGECIFHSFPWHPLKLTSLTIRFVAEMKYEQRQGGHLCDSLKIRQASVFLYNWAASSRLYASFLYFFPLVHSYKETTLTLFTLLDHMQGSQEIKSHPSVSYLFSSLSIIHEINVFLYISWGAKTLNQNVIFSGAKENSFVFFYFLAFLL